MSKKRNKMSHLRGAYGMHFQTKKIKPKKAEKATGLGCQQPSPLLEGRKRLLFFESARYMQTSI